MSKRYERQCWDCHGKDMDDKGSYVQCRSCGATWNEVQKIGASPITITDDKTGGAPRRYAPTHASPSGALARSVARKRGQN